MELFIGRYRKLRSRAALLISLTGLLALAGATNSQAGVFWLDSSTSPATAVYSSASGSYVGDSTPETVTLKSASSNTKFRITGSSVSAGTGCSGTTSIDCPVTSSTPVVFYMGDGSDTVTFSTPPTVSQLNIDLGAGSDTVSDSTTFTGLFPVTVTGDTGSDNINLYNHDGVTVLSGGDDSDTLAAGDGDDSLDGGNGDDLLYADRHLGGDAADGRTSTSSCSGCSSDGADAFVGGDGVDTVTYLNRYTTPLSLSADDVDDDGASGEGDNIGSDVEGIIGGKGNDTFYNTGGPQSFDGGYSSHASSEDTVDYSDSSADIVFSIDDSGFSGTANDGSDTDGDGVADEGDSDYRIENVVGGSGNDHLTGSSSDYNQLYGGDGNDELHSGGNTSSTKKDYLEGNDGDDTFLTDATSDDGSDEYVGGSGDDEVSYAARTAAVSVSLSDTTANDGQSGETDYVHQDIEKVVGGSANDSFTGQSDSTTNIFTGGDGDDTFTSSTANGADGADEYIGGDGTTDNADHDIVKYSSRTSGVTVDLTNSSADDGQGSEGDYVHTDIEDVTTGSGNDVLIGNSSVNTFTAGGGSDSLKGGDGDDVLVGDLGNDTYYASESIDGNDTITDAGNDTGGDTVDYSARPTSLPVTVDPDGNADDGSASESDNVATGIDNIEGSAGDDTLSGTASENILSGNGGNDVITGHSGNDTLSGDGGDDTFVATSDSTDGLGQDDDDSIDGGEGSDIADYTVRQSDLIIDLEDTANDGQEGESDNVGSSIEILRTGGGSDILTGSDHSTEISGGDGNDNITGGNSIETLNGEDGDDHIYSRDGIPAIDTDNCGPGDDEATVDGFAPTSIDIVNDCETVIFEEEVPTETTRTEETTTTEPTTETTTESTTTTEVTTVTTPATTETTTESTTTTAPGTTETTTTPPVTETSTESTTTTAPASTDSTVSVQSVTTDTPPSTTSSTQTVAISSAKKDENKPVIVPSRPSCGAKSAAKTKTAKKKYKKCIKNKAKLAKTASAWKTINAVVTDASYSSGIKSAEFSVIVKKGKKCLYLKAGKLKKAKSCVAAKKSRTWVKGKVLGSISEAGGSAKVQFKLPGLKKGMTITSSLYRATDNAGLVSAQKSLKSSKLKYNK